MEIASKFCGRPVHVAQVVVVGDACFRRDAKLATNSLVNSDNMLGTLLMKFVDSTLLVGSYYSHDEWQCANTINVTLG